MSTSSFRALFRTSRVRRSLAACVVVLAAGGLVLVRAPQGEGTHRDAAATVDAGPTTGSV